MPSQEDIQDAFSSFDKDGQSLIPKIKVGSALRCLDIPVSEAEISTIVSQISGQTVDLKTFTSIVSETSSKPRPSKLSVIEQCIAMFQSDDGKYINIQDLRHALNQIGEKIDDIELDELFQQVTLNSNGQASVAEFKQLLQ